MEEWIYKPDPKADWMSLIFLLNLVILAVLYKLNPNRLKSLVNILKPRIYFGKYSHEKELNYFSYFNTLSFFLIASTLTLTYFSLSAYSSKPLNYSFEYYYLLIGVSAILFFRHILTQVIANQLGFQRVIKMALYKNFSLATQSSIILIGLVFLWNYSSLPLIFIESILVLIALFWVINQFTIYFSFFKSRSEDLIYIILYLCTVKLAPWIWVYLVFVETKL
ncbi:DUF4271 domain-containing protein [Flavobacteriaceae bacterium]|nr:DUF4271 domain-containing protein [Flavobacteriaceae bacterium]MDA9016123.1 DUF4271 domain-containing protein [Flavobacteriaceae bacterium]MDA9571993.1 DUF4271 domain-containing protein [Flavobacteriaceae bacterium]